MVDLTSYTTLRSPVKAQKLLELVSEDQLRHEIDRGTFTRPYFILGDGANVLFTKDFPGTVILNRIKSPPQITELGTETVITVGSGFNWHDLVMFSVQRNLSGLENLVLIPGTVGAAVAGNIAAYGQNQEDVFDSATAINLKTGSTESFSKADCRFTYRHSAFKTTYADYLITSATYRLSKTAHLELSYHAARHASLLPELQKIASEPYTVADVAQAVINLRTAKLPDWKTIRTAGSFFKNPTVSKTVYLKLKSRLPSLPAYPPEKLLYSDDIDWLDHTDQVKIPAGMLLEELGWKGRRIGNVGTSPSHALILIAYPGATGSEIFDFAQKMRADFKTDFGLELEYEVVII